MQPRYMPTDVFLRLEKEWQHIRHAERHLELEAERPHADEAMELTPTGTTQGTQGTQGATHEPPQKRHL